MSIDTDSGTLFHFKYLADGRSNSAGYYEVRIRHIGETINGMEVKQYDSGAAYTTKKALEKMEETLKDHVSSAQECKPIVAENYSKKDFPALLDALDKKIQAFSANACAATFNEILPVKMAIEAKINAISLEERGKFSAPMSNLNMYISTIQTQLANPLIDIKMFAGTYVSQMQLVLTELVSLIK